MSVVYRFDEFELNAERYQLRRAGVPLRADALVIRLLGCLVRNAGRLVTKDELVNEVWDGRAVADNAITVSMARLRKTLGRGGGDRDLIATLYGRGYRFESDVTVVHSNEPAPLLARVEERSAPVVGRDRVFTRLMRLLALARDGRGRAGVLIGEAGIGKTCAAERFANEAAGLDVRVAWGHCREAGDTPPLWPWLRVLREMFERSSRRKLDEALGPAAAELVALCNEQRTPGPGEAMPEAPILQGPNRHRTFDNIVRAFSLAAEQAPWLVIVEDLHRADAASLELFLYLLEELPRTRILLLATARPAPNRRADTPSTQLNHALGHPNCERFPLERLQVEDVKAYVGALLDDAGGEIASAVYAKSEGNPFFMVELCRQLRAADAPDPESLSVPDAALDLIWQPIARLDAETRRVLSAAAVLGRSFELSRLQAVTEREPRELMACLDEALATELVIAAPDSRTAFAFGHELLRAVLYDSLPAPERRHWHLRIGLALEKRAQAGEAVAPSELAYHAYAALPESDPRRTVDHCRAAAGAAAQRYANLDVVRYLRHALEALDLVENASIRLRMRLLFTSSLYARSCDPLECERVLNEVLRLARERSDTMMMVNAACMLNVHPGFKPLRGATPALEHALGLIGDGDPALRSPALAALAAAAPYCYSAERTQALFDEAVPLARQSGMPAAVYAALVYKLWSLGGPAAAEEATALATELEALARENPKRMPVLPLDLAMFRAFTALQQGEARRSTAALDFVAARSRAFDKGELSWHSERALVVARLNAGDCAGVLDALGRHHRVAAVRSIIGTEVFCAFDRAVIEREITGACNLDDECRHALRWDDSEPPSIWSMKVRALAAAGFSDEARSLLTVFSPEQLAQLPCSVHYLGTLGHLARSAIALSAHDYVRALYDLLAPYPELFCGHVSYICEGSVSQLLGELASALGESDRAIAHFEAGIAANDRAGFARCAVEARVEFARCLRARASDQDRARAEELATAARTSAERLGFRRLATAAAELL